MQPLTRGIYTARLAQTAADMAAAQALRLSSFRTGRGVAGASDADRFDARCQHVLIRDAAGLPVGCFRLMEFASGRDISASYAAQFYDLSCLHGLRQPLLELGRFCLHPARSDPDILRLAWAALAQIVDTSGTGLLFGCSSFDGADPAPHLPALGYLARHHLAPLYRVGVRAPDTIALTALPAPDRRPVLPSLLQTYVAMGAHVSDHAVIDRDLDTLHVFTTLDIAAIPAARARALRALAHATS